MTKQHLTERELDEHLRRTLHAVAATVDGKPAGTRESARRHRLGRRLSIGLGAGAVAIPLAAGALFGMGPEYVDELPPKNVLVAGSADGSRYWMVESFHKDPCGPVPGVELVAEENNFIGREWNTVGVTYGTEGAGCGFDVAQALTDPALTYSAATFVGDAFIRAVAVHPDVTAVQLTFDGTTKTIRVHPVDGAGYALLELPPGTSHYSFELVAQGHVVPDSEHNETVPQPRP